jgi:hypothetical protein
MGLRLTSLSISGALLLISGVAVASPSYPVLIQQDLGGTTCAPACTICHRDNNGGTGTVVTPFGRNMMGLGLVAESPAALKHALTLEEQAGTDSSGDGITDIAALMACQDPNVFEAVDGGVAGEGGPVGNPDQFTDPTPEYGCSMGRAPNREGAAWAVAMCVLWTATLLRRRAQASRC